MWSTIFYGIGDAFQWFFKLLPPIGMIVAIFFWCTIAIGCAFWLIYGSRVEHGHENYMAVPGEKEEIVNK